MNTGLLLEMVGKSLLIGLLAALLLRTAARRPAAVRAAIAHAGLLALLVLPLLMFALPRWNAPLLSSAWLAPAVEQRAAPPTPFDLPGSIEGAALAPRSAAPLDHVPTAAVGPAVVTGTSAVPHTVSKAAWPWLLYAVPAGVLLLALLLAMRRLVALGQRAHAVEQQNWQQALQRVCRGFGWSRPVALKSTAELEAPISCGWRRPAVLLDLQTLARETSPTVAEALLAHELAHIVRRDWLHLLLARLATALHWFNPCAWWLAAQAHQLREEAADDAVLRRGLLDGGTYAQLLVRAARAQQSGASIALAHGMAAGGLKARVTRILDPQLDRRPLGRAWLLACAALALAVAAPLAALVPAVERPERGLAREDGSEQVRRALAERELAPMTSALAALSTAGLDRLQPNLAALSLSAARTDGPLVIAWTAYPTTPRKSDGAPRVQLGLSFSGEGHHYNSTSAIALSELSGLALQQMAAGSSQPVGFTLTREAGSLACRGEGRQGNGAGTCTFSPSADYLAALERHGLERPNQAQHLQLVLSDVRIALLDALKRQNYDQIDIHRLVEAGIHGVSPEWLDALAATGYHAGSVRRLVEFRIHGVDADFIRGMAAVSPQYGKLDPAELVEFRIHGVSPERVRALAAAGYRDLRQQDLVSMAIHGATPAYIQALAALGYRDIPASRLVEMRIHGVSPEWIAELAELGYRDLQPAKLVEMRIHGVSPAWIAELAALGYRDISPSKLVEMHIHGVDAEFIRAKLQERREGRDLSVDRLVQMKIMGD